MEHILLECSLYCAERRDLFKTLTDLGLVSFSIRTLFGFHNNHQQIETAILQFLRDTGLYGRIQIRDKTVIHGLTCGGQ